MHNAPDTVVTSAELPVFVIDALQADGAPPRPRLEVVFDARTRLIVGFRLTEGRRRPLRRRGSHPTS